VESRFSLTAVLLGIAGAAGTALALGAGRPPRPENPGVVAVREAAKDPGRAAFRALECNVCHGDAGEGGAMGPAIGPILPEYLAAAGGDRTKAMELLADYIRHPKQVPTRRRDGIRYPNPMPGNAKVPEAEIRKVVEFVLRIAPPERNVGGDGTSR
jgi:mono/diheme cytochrome c family protein